MNAAYNHQADPAVGNARADSERPPGQRARLITALDRAIALLMTAIVLTLAWPVGMALWGQSHTAQSGTVCLNAPSPTAPANPLPTAPKGRT